jgi:formylglycine-generating enzyme required for sulfatase activity
MRRATTLACAALLAGAIGVAAWSEVPFAAAAADVPAASGGGGAMPGDAKPFVQQIPGTSITFKMVPIPAGEFKMGSPASEKGHKADEAPQIDVKVDALYMGETEVTWDAYNEFLSNYQRLAGNNKAPKVTRDQYADAVTYPTPMYEMDAGPALQRMGRGPKFPAVIMSQYAARQFTKWLSYKTGRFYRLPTEAEWEYACRAGTTTAYSFGDDPKKLADYAWFIDNSTLADGDTAYHQVATKKPNPWGLYDMHGNVSNWCLDQYDKDWYKKFAGKTVSWHDIINWPSSATQYPRVYRGGNYDAEAEECRSTARHFSTRELNKRDPQLPKSPYWQTEGFMLGFRLVAPVQEPSQAEKLKYWEADNPVTARDSERDRDIREKMQPAPAASTTTK